MVFCHRFLFFEIFVISVATKTIKTLIKQLSYVVEVPKQNFIIRYVIIAHTLI
jgi:hypothetical protein